MKRVSLFTTFYEVESGYSLVAVAENQIRMLLDHGYDPIILVQEGFEIPKAIDSIWKRQMIDLRPVVPPIGSEDFSERLLQALKENLREADVCIAHDIILQDYYREHDKVMREYAKSRDDLLWLHSIHSRPRDKRPTPPGYIIYPNAIDAANVCRCYNTQRVVANRASHSIDPLRVWPYHQLTKDLVRKSDLLGGEVVAVYPRGGDPGKRTEKVIRLLAGVKRIGYEVRLLVIDWQSQGDRFQRYMDEMTDLANSYEVKIAFTSRLHDKCSQGVPRQVVMELMDLSNVYIHPSEVETYSLVVHEAILRGKLVCLNHDLPMMHELFGESGIYFDFGSDFNSHDYAPNEQAFWNDEAHTLVGELRKNRALWAQTQARRKWTPQAMWREFERLLYLDINKHGQRIASQF